MKKRASLIFITMIVSLSGCGTSSTKNTDVSQKDIQTESEIESETEQEQSNGIAALSEEQQQIHKNEATETEYSTEQFEAEFRAACQEYSYDDIARKTDELNGSYAKLTAEIAQVIKGDDDVNTYYDAYVDADFDGYYESEICIWDCRQSGSENLLEDDIIELYGMLDGQTSLDTLAGETVYMPQIDMITCDRISK